MLTCILHLPQTTNNKVLFSLSFFIIDNCCISKCPVSSLTTSIALETVIMYVLMRGGNRHGRKGGDAVKHVSEYQSLSPAVNNDSTAALVSPAETLLVSRRELPRKQRMKETYSFMSEGWGRSKIGDQDFTEQRFKSVIISVLHNTCVEIQNSDRWKRSVEALFVQKQRKAFSVWVVQLVSKNWIQSCNERFRPWSVLYGCFFFPENTN